MRKSGKWRKILLWVCLLALFAGLVWGVDAELMQVNKDVQTTASLGADDEMAAIETANMVKPRPRNNAPSGPPIDWARINRYEAQLKANTQEYHRLIERAGMEKQVGSISEATKRSGLNSANQFNTISNELADVYQRGNCITKAKAIYAAGQSRIKNAEMAFNDLGGTSISNYTDERKSLVEAHDASLKEDIQYGDKAELLNMKRVMRPRYNNMGEKLLVVLHAVDNIFKEVNRTVQAISGGGVGAAVAAAGCVKQLVDSAREGRPTGTLGLVWDLIQLIKSLFSGVSDTTKLLDSIV